MFHELPQKRPSSGNTNAMIPASRSATTSSMMAAVASCVPPKKRPRWPDANDDRCPAPLDLSAKMPPCVAAPTAAVAEPSVPATDCSWRAAAAAAMYAQYMAYLTSMSMPTLQSRHLQLQAAPSPLPPLPKPLLKAPSASLSPLSASSSAAGSSGGGRRRETDFRCACSQSFDSLMGLTLHLNTAMGPGHAAASAPVDSAAGSAPTSTAKELPKLVRGQDMWINSETEQTREILRCMRCKQSYPSLPELTMHMVRSRHYAEIMYSSSTSSSSSDGAAAARVASAASSAVSAKRRRSSQVQQTPPAAQRPRDPPSASATSVALEAPPAYISPDAPPPSSSSKRRRGDTGSDSNPLSCLQRLVNETALSRASAAAASAASPSMASFASSSSMSEAADEDVKSPAAPLTPASSVTSPPLLQLQLQPQLPLQKKKTKCQYCDKPFANKGQVRLHVSKGKCPAAVAPTAGLTRGGFSLGYPAAAAAAAAARTGLFGPVASVAASPWELPMV